MAGFLALAAVLVACAIAFAAWSLWRTSRPLALGLAVALPLVAGALYALVGAPAALDPAAVAAPAAEQQRTPTMEEAIAKLEQHVAAEPQDLEGMLLLARTYMTLGRFDKAPPLFARAVALAPDDVDLSVDYAEALLRAAPDRTFPADAVVRLEQALERFDRAPPIYARAVALAPDDVDLSVDYAESLLRASPGRTFPPAAVTRLEQALERQPDHQRALFFLGLQRMQQAQPAQAAALWERLLPQLDPEAAAALREQVDVARGAAGLPPLPAPAAAPPAPGIDITVAIAPALAADLPADAVLYVFARTPDGGGPPLAAKRIAPATLPQTFRLTDADSPMPAGKLSSVPQVVLMARLSRHGDVAAASGDIESTPAPSATADAAPVTLVLDRVVP
jgi:cytochrome c-type biogenesis protein CcmH